ncbi:MAG: Rpn family recombination-promoting nuclease/putative transposase [Lachnospiraceae bacterium]|nr:Rpn family recombination-promoting nuclease/putative transposase [Lachnospiraceae bacterium]
MTKDNVTAKESMAAGGNKAAEKERKKKGGRKRGSNLKYRDSSGKIIFEDPILCSQFLRNYAGIALLKDVRPEDIEDVTERYVHLFTEERNSDIVKKINLKNNSFYLVSLIEHKSDVDYNTIMQMFRYITFIWEDYEKEQERMHAGISKTKGFRYPPVLPVVFYDGTDNWTAATSLHERVLLSDILGKYIPDYNCILVQLKDYSNMELMEKKDEISILMMIDRLKNMADYERLSEEMDETFLKEATENSPEYLLDLMVRIIGVFLSKLNVPQEEADMFTEQIKERKMGELFKHFEGWDVQAIRKEAREEARKEARKEVREEARKEAREEAIRTFLNAVKSCGIARENAMVQLAKGYRLSIDEAEEKMELYWQEETKV